MTALDKQKVQAIERNFSNVVDFLDRKLHKTNIHLKEVPCYFYQGNESKLEITVFSNPRIATIDVRMINVRNDAREPYFECSYDLADLSMTVWEKAIDDLISKTNEREKDSL
ncbi:conserved hypothetical protein [Hyella patelloides LEGE 07179]|uniref:DUF5655 domain-containing protein n=1 Tax=Hyella patelloides LEGE 07179 TaxID=945734 RepID=A0A563W3V9_9CYAN|nr:hypothetical protein [Hyella patelloides]VEP18364.1 conserved hypothetical protein [Hyella patelloides LEGE 07179]